MKIIKNSWDWVKNHIEAINFGVVLFVLAFVVWLSVHIISVESQLRNENQFLRENLIRMEQSLGGAVNHINEQESQMRNQRAIIESQSDAIKKLIDRINNLTALLNGHYT
jgi:predicted aspartyl protease